MKTMEELYKERVDRLKATVLHKEPDIVPIIQLAETWNVGYASYKIKEIQNNPEKEIDAFNRAYEEIYLDAGMISYFTRNVQIFKRLEGGAYFISSDGVTIQHKEYVHMKDNEYPQLIKDPMGFTESEIFPRKYPALNKPYPENLEALKDSAKLWGNHVKMTTLSTNYAREKYGMPIIVDSTAMAPVDMIMDFYRGFQGIMGDIHRRPEELKEAAEALIPMIMAGALRGRTSLEEFPYIFIPLHIPTYLRPKQFEEIYWPSFKKVLENVHRLGGKALVYLEGNWEHLYDFVNEFPKDFAIVLMEKDDIFKAKDKIGKTVTIAGGMDLSMLKNESKEKCIDHAKKVIDHCAPGGGFIFTTDKIMLTATDVNVDNLKAVNEFVHSYGTYR